MGFQMKPAPFKKVERLKKVVKQLEGASKMHAGQLRL